MVLNDGGNEFHTHSNELLRRHVIPIPIVEINNKPFKNKYAVRTFTAFSFSELENGTHRFNETNSID